jgi:signal transduction histidine kinase/ligand-binding sensor domain-containing protein
LQLNTPQGTGSSPGSPVAQFEHLTTADGLSQSTVTSILQDSQGYMWFGTQDGLNKYDGYTFTVYRHDPDDPSSLRDDNITTIYEDRSGVLWIGTNEGWLERFDRQNDIFIHYQTQLASIQTIYETQNGDFWVLISGTYNGTLYSFDREKGEFQVVFSNGTKMIEDSSGGLWLGDIGGWIYFHDDELDIFRPIAITVPMEGEFEITAIIEQRSGALWIGRLGAGLSRFERENTQSNGTVARKFTHFRHNPDNPHSLSSDNVTTITEDPSGSLWIGTSDSGLNHFDPETGQFSQYHNAPWDPNSLSSGAIQSLYIDRSGVLWVGTLNGGLNKLNLMGNKFNHYKHIQNVPNSLVEDNVLAIFQDQEGILWIGTTNGLDRFDRENKAWRHYQFDPHDADSLGHNTVNTIFEDTTGILWIGRGLGAETANVIYRFDEDKEVFTSESLSSSPMILNDISVNMIYEDRSGRLWSATNIGLFQYDRENDIFFEKTLGDIPSLAIFEDNEGILWIGTYEHGLGRLDGDRLTFYRADADDPNSLSHNQVFTILEDHSGILWIGTASGLNRFDRITERFTHFGIKDGLPNDEILGILEDGRGYLWLSTLSGLSRFDPRTETFRNYDVSDVLQSNEFNPGATFKSDSGEMFFGGINGFNAFYPDQITDNTHIPPVVITTVNLFHQAMVTNPSNAETIKLKYNENTLSFEFAALDYAAPEKNQYAYMMEGLDEDWVPAGSRRFAEYRDLRSGNYIFRVKGSNNDGVWNEQGAAVHIIITPPLWGTWWFRGGVALVLIAIAFGTYGLRVRSLQTRSRQLEQQVQERTAELSETNLQMEQEIEISKAAEEELAQQRAEAAVLEERNRMARDLHDAVTQSLYSLTLLAGAGSRMDDLDQIKGNQSRLGEIAMLALQEARLMVFELRPLALENEGLVGALEQRLETVERRAGIDARLQVEGQIELPPELEKELYRIAQEALNNALKHAKASDVVVSLHANEHQFTMEVADNGCGFDPETVHGSGGVGMSSMAERAKKIGAEYKVESTPGRGTKVSVTIGTKGRS